LRLLLSDADLGPAEALLSLCESSPSSREALTGDERVMLTSLLERERTWMQDFSAQRSLLTTLRERGWTLETDHWDESLSLPIDASLAERWLGPERPFQAVLSKGAKGAKEAALLRRLLNAMQGSRLPQRLRHRRVVGQRRPDSGTT